MAATKEAIPPEEIQTGDSVYYMRTRRYAVVVDKAVSEHYCYVRINYDRIYGPWRPFWVDRKVLQRVVARRPAHHAL